MSLHFNSGQTLVVGDFLNAAAWVAVWGVFSPPYVLASLITIFLYASGGLYRPRLSVSLLDQLPNLLGRMGIATASSAVIVVIIKNDLDLHEYVMRSGILVAAHLAVRTIANSAIRATRKSGTVTHDTIVVGNSRTAHKVVETLDNNRMYGLSVVGYVGDPASNYEATHGWKHLGNVDQLLEIVEDHDIRVVVFDDEAAGHSGALGTLRIRMDRLQSIFVVPRIIEAGVRYDLDDHIGAIPVLRLKRPGPGMVQRISKRCLDLVLATTFLILLSPVMVAVMIAVYLDDRQNVIFKQVRVGLNGKLFTIYKFRSMRPPPAQTADTQWSAESRERIGRVGKIIRMTSLDELPQLVNILKGDMTFVGPRPERPHFVEEFSARLPHYQYRHRVQVGLTGLAQVSGLRGDTSIDDRARHDNYYIDHWNLWFDLKVILWTLSQVVRAKGS